MEGPRLTGDAPCFCGRCGGNHARWLRRQNTQLTRHELQIIKIVCESATVGMMPQRDQAEQACEALERVLRGEDS